MTLASTIFGLSLLVNLYVLAYLVLSSDSVGAQKSVITKGDAAEKIALLPVEGLITGKLAEDFEQRMKQIEQDKTVKAVVLSIETPGGEVTASDQINQRITRFRQDNPSIPVVVSMGFLATSGGYYISCAAEHIVAQPTTWTGNIGVMMPRFNFAELAKKWGFQDATLTAPAKGFKNAGSMFQPIQPEETEYLQGLIDDAYRRFTQVVTTGRGSNLKKPIDEIANGKVYTATEALSLGLVDQIGYLADAQAWAQQKAGLKRPTVVKYQKRASMLDLLSAESWFGGGQNAASAGGVNVKLDPSLLEELSRPRLMYLWRGD